MMFVHLIFPILLKVFLLKCTNLLNLDSLSAWWNKKSNSQDTLKVCPRYTAVLARSEDDGIGIEELDTLQLELETLLSSASRRLRVLEAETQVIPCRGDIITRGL